MLAMADSEESEQLTIIIMSQDGEKTHFKVKKKTKMKKVFEAFSQKKGVARDSLKFMFDGERVADDTTPKLLDMEDMDQIDAFLEQTGG